MCCYALLGNIECCVSQFGMKFAVNLVNILHCLYIHLFIADIFEPSAVTARKVNLLPGKIKCREFLEVALNVDNIRSGVAGEVQLEQWGAALHLCHCSEGS